MIKYSLSGQLSARQAEKKVVKIYNPDFSYWAWSTPWEYVLSLKTFCQIPALGWEIRYANFQLTKPERIYNPITPMGFSAMFTFQLNNTKR